jgi:uncharacterized protein GlcG (DUF336 family)
MHRPISLSPRALVTASAVLLAACSDSTTGPAVHPLAALLPSHNDIRAALRRLLTEQNGGLGFEMWASIVDRNGFVLDVVFSGVHSDDQWPGSRVISAQKANTANAFSLDGFALSTANLFAAVQPGGSLFGLQESNPVDPAVAYGGRPADYGTRHDFMIGKRIGGINVFGGGLALYDHRGNLVGGLGLSGDTSCSDHIIAWKLRHALNLDNVPAGVAGPAPGTDNIIYIDGTLDGFEHPTCFDLAGQGDHITIGKNLPTSHPVGPNDDDDD